MKIKSYVLIDSNFYSVREAVAKAVADVRLPHGDQYGGWLANIESDHHRIIVDAVIAALGTEIK